MYQKIVRNLKNPVALAKKIMRVRKLAKRFTEEDRQYWISLKDLHKGKRGFVIGNGPSLTMSDLEMLKDEVTIASNKIYLAFDQTQWRPSYYTAADPILWEKIKREINIYFDVIHVPTYLDKENEANTRYWKSTHMGLLERFSGDMSKRTYSGQTITYENIQLAVHLGLDPIYIIGCDHNYPGEKNVKAGVAIQQSEHQSHFIKNYRKKGEVVLPASIIDMEIAYQAARDYCDAHDIRIYNATRGGQLDVFERIDLDSVLKGKVT